MAKHGKVVLGGPRGSHAGSHNDARVPVDATRSQLPVDQAHLIATLVTNLDGSLMAQDREAGVKRTRSVRGPEMKVEESHSGSPASSRLSSLVRISRSIASISTRAS